MDKYYKRYSEVYADIGLEQGTEMNSNEYNPAEWAVYESYLCDGFGNAAGKRHYIVQQWYLSTARSLVPYI